MDQLIGFICSIVANNIPTISDILEKNKKLTQELNKCYENALNKWCENDEIREEFKEKCPSIETLKLYLSHNKVDGTSGEVELLRLWADELRNNQCCYSFILETKLDKIDANFREVYETLKKYEEPIQTKSFYEASSILRSYVNWMGEDSHIERSETSNLYNWIKSDVEAKDTDKIAVLLGNAGIGKTVILHDLQQKLETENEFCVLALKADQLFDNSTSDLDQRVGLGCSILQALKLNTKERDVVLIIDQIDALSSMMSNNRLPLTTLLALIKEASHLPRIRIVVSCRYFEYHFDVAFDILKDCQIFEVKNLDEESVKKVLNSENIHYKDIPTQLTNPLYLSLYCRIGGDIPLDSQLSLMSLYGALWEKIITRQRENHSNVQLNELIDFLNRLTSCMMDRQVLSIHKSAMGTSSMNAQQYLLSNDIITLNQHTQEIQFSHQTLFDYVYARMFFEEGKTLEEEFESRHQGPYIHLRLKQVLAYQRIVDVDRYVKNLRTILDGKKQDGGWKYRFQIRQLIIHILCVEEQLLYPEKNVILHNILTNKEYAEVFYSSVMTSCGFELILQFCRNRGGFKECEPAFQLGILNTAQRVAGRAPLCVAKFLNELDCSSLDSKQKDTIIDTINYMPLSLVIISELSNIIKFFDQSDEMIFGEYYSHLLKLDLTLVDNRLIEYVSSNLGRLNNERFERFKMSYQVEHLLRQYRLFNRQKYFDILIRLLSIIVDKTKIDASLDIISSNEFYSFNRTNESLYSSSELLKEALELVEELVNEESISDSDLKKMSLSPFAALQIIAMTGWLRNVQKYKEDIYAYLLNTLTKTVISSAWRYYHLDLLKKVFTYLTLENQTLIIDEIDKINPEWEKRKSSYSTKLYIGFTRGQYLNQIPESLLKHEFKDQWSTLEEAKRKYSSSLDNEEPNKIRSFVGWSTLPDEAYKRMSDEDIMNSMEKYNKNETIDFETPSMQGHALMLKGCAQKEPERFYHIFDKVLRNHHTIDFTYLIQGIEGLLKTQYDIHKINKLVDSLIKKFPQDINICKKSDLIDVIRLADLYGDRPRTESMFKLICKVALEANDIENQTSDNFGYEQIAHRIDMNDGINQVRGCAVEILIKFYSDDALRREQVFSILEEIAPTASIATRCAALFRLAALIRYDRQRTLNIFLKLTHDYDVNLLCLPLHNYNPLVYLIKTDLETLIPYFKACITHEECHAVNITLLFGAWLRNQPKAKDLLFEMADASMVAKVQLIRDTRTYYAPQYHDKIEQIWECYKMVDNKDLGLAFDDIFDLYQSNKAELSTCFVNVLKSPIAKYLYHDVYEYIAIVTKDDPKIALSLVEILYTAKKDTLEKCPSELMKALLMAYNSIRKFDKNDSVLEEAMDILDISLQQGQGLRVLNDCLNQIS